MTHSQLLIRAKKNKSRNFNVDIIFKGVLSIIFPTDIMGLEISVEDKGRAAQIPELYNFKNAKDYEVFEIKNAAGKSFYINAMCFGIYKNELDTVETSIGRYDRGDLNELILWFSR